MTGKKILIIAESLDVEDSSGTKGRVALIRNLNSLGYQLKVYHYTRKHVSIEGIECIYIPENRKSLLFFLSRIERYARYILNLKLHKPLENGFGFSFTLLNDRNSIKSGLKKLKNWNADLVITLSKGGSFRPHHAILKMPEYHSRWMSYIHDPYPMHWYPPPYPWFEPGWKKKEKFMRDLATSSKFIAFPSFLLKLWLGKKDRNFSDKGVIIPHQLDEAYITDMDVSEFINFENFNIVHAGNLIQGRDPIGLILGFQRFLSLNPEARKKARLLFIGGPSYYSNILKSQRKEINQLILSEEKLSFELVQNIQSKSSVNVILEAKSEISPFLPGKFPHCIKAKKTILHLGPHESETMRLLGKNYKYNAPIDGIERIAELLTELFCMWQNDKDSLTLKRPDLVDYLSKDHLEKTMGEIFHKLSRES